MIRLNQCILIGLFTRQRQFGTFIWICCLPEIQEYIHHMIFTLKESFQKQIISNLIINIIPQYHPLHSNGPLIISAFVLKFEDIWKYQRLSHYLLELYQAHNSIKTVNYDHTIYDCFLSEQSLLVQSFQHALTQLEQYIDARYPAAPILLPDASISTASQLNQSCEQEHTVFNKTFQVCIQSWEDMKQSKEQELLTEAALGSPIKTPVYPLSTKIFNQEETVICQRKLLANWATCLSTCHDKEESSIQYPSIDQKKFYQNFHSHVICTIRAGVVQYFGIPILQLIGISSLSQDKDV